mmetsp:Transcript_108220/g.304965  ORF Transcript_108220/g.304965 Transcript_108220/m.304965 type:complete len:228 (+) Transcript_108220:193-876(+)
MHLEYWRAAGALVGRELHTCSPRDARGLVGEHSGDLVAGHSELQCQLAATQRFVGTTSDAPEVEANGRPDAGAVEVHELETTVEVEARVMRGAGGGSTKWLSGGVAAEVERAADGRAPQICGRNAAPSILEDLVHSPHRLDALALVAAHLDNAEPVVAFTNALRLTLLEVRTRALHDAANGLATVPHDRAKLLRRHQQPHLAVRLCSQRQVLNDHLHYSDATGQRRR